MRLYFIRHGQTAWNSQRRFQGHSNPRLDKTGRIQSEKLAKYIKKFPINRFYSSSLVRARQTSMILSRELKVNVEFLDGIKEINLGLWEGRLTTEVDKKYKDGFTKWLVDPESIVIPSAEPIRVFKKRVMDTITSIIDRNKQGDNLGIITHGGVIAVVIAHILGTKFGKILLQVRLDNTGITIIDVFDRYSGNTKNLPKANVYNRRDFFIRTVNHTPHL